MNTVSFVIGSWGSYNECNERALGSKWLDTMITTIGTEILSFIGDKICTTLHTTL